MNDRWNQTIYGPKSEDIAAIPAAAKVNISEEEMPVINARLLWELYADNASSFGASDFDNMSYSLMINEHKDLFIAGVGDHMTLSCISEIVGGDIDGNLQYAYTINMATKNSIFFLYIPLEIMVMSIWKDILSDYGIDLK